MRELQDRALELHQAGDFDAAERMYREILEQEHGHARALDLLGVLHFQRGRNDDAIQLIRGAIAADPNAADFHGHLGLVLAAKGGHAHAVLHYRRALTRNPRLASVENNLGNSLRETGRSDEAIGAYQRAIALQPDFAEAHANLGLALAEQGRFAEAAAAYRRATELKPSDPAGWFGLGETEFRLRNFDAAIEAFERGLELRPDDPDARNNLGMALFERGRTGEAVMAYRRALSLRRDFAEARYNLGISLRSAGDLNGAAEQFAAAVALRPDFAEAYNNLGITLQEIGRGADAIAALERAITLRPDSAETHGNLGNALRQSGRLKEAIEAYGRAVTLRPDSAEAHNNLGNALRQSGRIVEAIASFRRALELQPNLAEACNNLGNAFKDQGDLDEAIACYERAADLAPNDPAADSNRVYTLHFHPDRTAREILAEHLVWNRRHATFPESVLRPHENDPDPHRRLRIGYVSPDFRDHCQSLFTVPLFAHHDRRSFEIFCYSDTAAPDAVTNRLRGCVDQWRSTVGWKDAALVEQIRRDRIDLLIDLTSHMAYNRLTVFARRPAPVQATWLAYPGTTGLAAMDWRLSDPYLDPPGEDGGPGPHDRFYSERTLRLSDTFWCYDPLTDGPAVNDLPAARAGFVTFGCLNNFCKVTEPTVDLWARVLREVGRSRLLVLAPRGWAREHLLEKLQTRGIDPIRIEFADRQPRARYLELYHRIDIGLETFPYNGHTTSLDSVWMGVPVPTRIGRTAVGRGGWSQLNNLGLRELAAKSDRQYVRIVRDLGGDLTALARLRATLRERLRHSPLMNAPRFAGDFEAACRHMWRQWTEIRKRPPAASA